MPGNPSWRCPALAATLGVAAVLVLTPASARADALVACVVRGHLDCDPSSKLPCAQPACIVSAGPDRNAWVTFAPADTDRAGE